MAIFSLFCYHFLAQDVSIRSEDEELPDNLSFLVNDFLSYKLKRNLSIEQPKEMMTSTPVSHGSRTKKLITPSKIVSYTKLQINPDLVEDDFEDSFDRMCNVKTGFCKK